MMTPFFAADERFYAPSREDLRDHLREHRVELRVYLPPIWLNAPYTASLWADGQLFDTVSVPVNEIAMTTLNPYAGLDAFYAAQEQLCVRYLISVGVLHPKEALP